MVNKIVSMLCILSFSSALWAQRSIYELEWDKKSEVLEYHSCGCADSCWVTELKNKRSGRIKMKLQCDCEKLMVTKPGGSMPVLYSKTCGRLNSKNKFDLIPLEIKKIMNLDKKK